MTRAEKVAALQAKAAALIKTFEGRTLPVGPLKIQPWANILDIEKYFSTTVAVINGSNNPFSRPYIAAYFRLMEFKTYLDEHFPTDSKPSPVQDPAKPGH
jgi:hypothetical protein